MAELIYKPKRDQGSSVVVTGADGKDHEFVAGQPVDEEKVPESVRAYVRDGVPGYNIAAPAPDEPEAAADSESAGPSGKGGRK